MCQKLIINSHVMKTIPQIILNLRLKHFFNSLNVAHINVCSLYPKMFNLREIMQDSPIKVLCLSETWLNNVHTNKMVHIDGYKIIRHDRSRSDRRGTSGGVCMYISDELSFKIVDKS